ncbi:MAG: hypothetical protein ABH874_01320 [Methanobacteriota archaeon]
MSRAFIFTMDAVLALIPVFIILAGVSQLGSSESLLLQSHVLGSERIAQDVLQVMSTTGNIESLNQSRLSQTLRRLVPSYLNYSYEVENVNGSVLFAVTNGTLAGRDIVVARRLGLLEIDKAEGELNQVRRGVNNENACWLGKGGNKPRFNLSFYVDIGEKNTYDYWLVGEIASGNPETDAWVYPNDSAQIGPFDSIPGVYPDCDWTLPASGRIDLFPIPGYIPHCQCQPITSCKETISGFEVIKIYIDNYLEEGKLNHAFIDLAGPPPATTTFYIIKVPSGTCNTLVTSESAQLRDAVWVTLKVCPK